MSNFISTKTITLGSCAFRQWRATHSHCRLIHGYNLKAKIWFTGDLDNKNWIIDFGGLKEIREKLEHTFDHTFCVASDDPYLETFKDLASQGVLDIRILEHGVGCERFAEYVFKLVNDYIVDATEGRCWVSQVEVFEHENNSALYRRGPVTPVEVTIGSPEEKPYWLDTEDEDLTDEDAHNIVIDVVDEASTPQHNPRAAQVGNVVSGGLGNMFAGTSWGG